MAFKSVDGLAKVYLEILSLAASIKSTSTDLRSASAAGTISANLITNYFAALVSARDRLNTLKTAPGLLQYAKDQNDDQNYDISAEFTTMLGEVTDVINWIVSNFPKDAGSGMILKDTLSTNGIAVRQFTTASLAAFRTELDNLIATIA